MQNLAKFSFTNWLSSKQAVSFTLGIGVLFLLTNYQSVLFEAKPSNDLHFVYPYWLEVFLAHVDSLFFGLATCIIIFQSTSKANKVIYCVFEGVCLFLSLNQNHLNDFGMNTQFLLSTYIAVFSGVTLFYLGNLAKQHNELDKALGAVSEDDISEEEKAIRDMVSTSNFVAKYPKVVEALREGKSLNEAARVGKVSRSTAQKIRTIINTPV